MVDERGLLELSSLSIGQDFEIPEISFQDVECQNVFYYSMVMRRYFSLLVSDYCIHNSHASLVWHLEGLFLAYGA